MADDGHPNRYFNSIIQKAKTLVDFLIEQSYDEIKSETMQMKSSTQRILLTGFAIPLTLFVQGCSGAASSTVSIAAITPIVKKALPAGLVPGAVSAHFQSRLSPPTDGLVHAKYTGTTQMTVAAQYITNMFQNYYAVGGSTNYEGFILAETASIDSRTSLYSGSTTSSHSCLGATTKPYTIDLSALNPSDLTSPNMMKFTLADVSCSAAFSGTQGSTGGSGEVFGVNGATTSVWVTTTDMAGDSLATGSLTSMIMANVTNSGSTSASAPEAVDAFVLSYNGSGATSSPNTYFMARFKAVPTLNTFEMYFTSNQASQGAFAGANANAGNGNQNTMGPGYRLVSDGSYIYADGVLCLDNTGSGDVPGSNCSTGTTSVSNSGALGMVITNSGGAEWSIFQVCLNATTLAVVDPVATADCLTLANAFTLSPNATTFTTQGIFTGGGNPVTQNPFLFTNLTGDVNLVDTTSMTAPAVAQISAAQLAVLTANYKATNASAVTTSY